MALVASLALLLSLAHAAEPAPNTVGGPADATLERDGGGLFLKARSRSFGLAQYAVGAETKTVLVEALVSRRLEVAEDLGAVGNATGVVTLSVRPITSDGHFAAPQATRELPGDAVEIASPSGVKVTSYGCCQQSSAETLLSLASLQTLYVRSEPTPVTTYTRLGPPAEGRVIAVYLAQTPSDEAVLGKDPAAVGLITVAGEDQVRQRILVKLNDAKAPRDTALEWSAEVGWMTAGALEPHVVVDPAKPSTPVWRWKTGAGGTIEIPLVDDRLDVAAATLPSGVALESIDVP